MRTSQNKFQNARLIDGYDYENQAWVIGGKYIACGHPRKDGHMTCNCYGTLHEGEETKQTKGQ